MRKRLLTLLLLVFFLKLNVPGSYGADQFLDTCLRIAEGRSEKLGVTRDQISLAKIRVVRSGRAFFPSLSVQRKFTRGKALKDEYQSEEIGLRGSQPLFEAGRIRAAFGYDSLMLDSAKYNYTKIREELFFNVKSAYYELLSTKMEYAALKKAFDEINKLAEKVQIEYKAKAISELDLKEALNMKEKVENMYRSSKLNLSLTTRQLTTLVNVESLNDVPMLMPEGLLQDVPEIPFTFAECERFLQSNNVEIKISKDQIDMSEKKKIMARSKVIPKLSLEGFYGKSGEAYVTEPLELATVWNVMGKLSWGLWGNSLELNQKQEKAEPSEIVEVSQRIDSTGYDLKLSLLDDLNYFVESKEAKVSVEQSLAEHYDKTKKIIVELEKTFNEYLTSLDNVRTLNNEIDLRERKLKLLRKRNELYEVSTLQVMEESLKYSEAISNHARNLSKNYQSVAKLEMMTLVGMR